MAAGKVYIVPAYNLEWLKSKVAKLSGKAEKLASSKIYLTVVGFTDKKQDDGSLLRFWEVFISGNEPKLNGWTFLARVTHHKEGNIVRVVPGLEIPDSYRTTTCYCDHCNRNRVRRDTYIVKHDSGEIKQVGSSCLKDFLGHANPGQMAKYAELLCELGSMGNDSTNHDKTMRDWRMVDTDDLLFHTAVAVGRYGWMSKKTHNELCDKAETEGRSLKGIANPSVSEATNMMFNRDYFQYNKPITDEERIAATDLVAKSLAYFNANIAPKENKSEYEHNLSVLLKAVALEFRETGMAGSVIGMYLRSLPKADKVDYRTTSKHVGKIGEKVVLNAKVLSKSSFQGSFGWTTVYKFDVDGNIFSAFVTGQFDAEKDEVVKIKGTIKKHDVYKDVNQTILTRIKAVA